jgi:hypothetical protein
MAAVPNAIRLPTAAERRPKSRPRHLYDRAEHPDAVHACEPAEHDEQHAGGHDALLPRYIARRTTPIEVSDSVIP